MGWLEFVASVVDTIIWPVLVFTLALVFRRSIVSAVKQLRHLKAPGVEADFGESLAEAEESTEALLDAAGLPSGAIGATPPSQVPVDPSGTILRAWQNLTVHIANLAITVGGKASARNPIDQIRQLTATLNIDPSAIDTVIELRNLRNAVAHGRHSPTDGEALAYAETAHELGAYLNFMMNHNLTHGP
ncbi:hypothetical protein [Cryobacterium arcticum]|uniref:hypothetical protein n=1 Tax=Cryobacterium arcticum TaxID=670052 RepID=UPI0012EE41EA|nr:hypothetical protein [Cryobacterium arcticum]